MDGCSKRKRDGHDRNDLCSARLLTEASLACSFARSHVPRRSNESRARGRRHSLRLCPLLLFSVRSRLVRYSNPIWRLIEQASEHEDLFDDVISNHIFLNDVAGIAARLGPPLILIH